MKKHKRDATGDKIDIAQETNIANQQETGLEPNIAGSKPETIIEVAVFC